MTQHLQQAQHNHKFLIYLDSNELSEIYCDWKITILFYTALHLMRAFCVFKSVSIPENHREFHDKINPKGKKNVLALPNEIFDCYFELYNQSRRTRYASGYNIDLKNMIELNKWQYQQQKKYINKILEYLRTTGFIFDLNN